MCESLSSDQYGQFIELSENLFRQFCRREGLEVDSPENVIRFLLTHSLIRDVDVKRFLVLKLYPSYLYEADGVKRSAIAQLSIDIGYSEREVWNIVGKHQRQFFPKKDVQLSLFGDGAEI